MSPGKTCSAVNNSKLQYTLQSPGVSQLEIHHLSRSYSCSKRKQKLEVQRKPSRKRMTIRCCPEHYFVSIPHPTTVLPLIPVCNSLIESISREATLLELEMLHLLQLSFVPEL